MAHHKRCRPKNRRAGCLFCKPWKMNGYGRLRPDSEQRRDHVRRMAAEWEIASTPLNDPFPVVVGF